MGILSFLGGIVKPAFDLIDNLHTSGEEKLQLKKAITMVENEFASKILDYESKLMESRSGIIGKEITGHSWLQRSWRPITMLTFLVLVVLNGFGLLKVELANEFWGLLKIGLGGYVVGRSAEKLIPALMRKK